MNSGLKFDQKVRAVAAIPVKDETGSVEYGVRVSGSAVMERVATLDGAQL